jgi:hypothetical protein
MATVEPLTWAAPRRPCFTLWICAEAVDGGQPVTRSDEPFVDMERHLDAAFSRD